jgi:hypothetical protein
MAQKFVSTRTNEDVVKVVTPRPQVSERTAVALGLLEWEAERLDLGAEVVAGALDGLYAQAIVCKVNDGEDAMLAFLAQQEAGLAAQLLDRYISESEPALADCGA